MSSVDYGRIIVVKITSSDTYSEMINKINASYSIIGGNYQMKEIGFGSSYEFSAQVVGGSPTSGIGVVNNLHGVMQAINSGADYTAGNPGYPIAFRVRHLVDGSLARTSQQCSYKEAN